MLEEKTENRFIRFFQRNRKIFLPFKYFVYLVGIVVIMMFTLDFIAQTFLKEDTSETTGWENFQYYHYEPYLDFKFSYPETNNPCKDTSEDPVLIYTFGGSTMWGVPCEKDKDIASYISDLLCKKKISVEVKNFGSGGYVNTQEVINLFLELGNGNVPDIVVFYDGANEINTGGCFYRTPQVFKYFADKINHRKAIFFRLEEYFSKRFGKADLSPNFEDDILGDYFYKFQLRTDGLEGEELYEKVMKIYLNNVKIIKSVEKDWGFKSFFYWQPSLYDKMKSLSGPEEEKVFSEKYSDSLKRLEIANPIVTEFLKDTKDVRDLREVFSSRSDTVFVDWCHILPENNKIIAEKMVEDIIKYLEESNYYEQK